MPLSQMTLSELLLPEFDEEMATTRRAIERAPAEKYEWRPHAKSNTLGWLVGLCSSMPSWVTSTLKQDSLDLMPAGKPPGPAPSPKSVRDALETFDKNVAEARAALAATKDEEFDRPWRLMVSGKTVVERPKYEILRTQVINHLVHHRAQLGVYLRLLDVPVPMTYGPTADERPWG